MYKINVKITTKITVTITTIKKNKDFLSIYYLTKSNECKNGNTYTHTYTLYICTYFYGSMKITKIGKNNILQL